MRKLSTAVFGLCVSLLISACNTSSSPQPVCGAPKGTVVVAYPAPSATAIPDNFIGIVFASTNGLSSSYQAIVVPNGSSYGVPLLPVAPYTPPLPTPNLTPTFPNPIYQASGANGYILPAASVINVYLNDLNSNCAPRYFSSFTSQ
jgi:hypothetical protein